MVLFEILSEDGFQRRCRTSFGTALERVKTPALIVPLNKYLLGDDEGEYINLIKKSSNIILQQYDSDLIIPGAVSSLNILSDINTNYYDQKGLPEKFIQFEHNRNKEAGILNIASKNCPNSYLSYTQMKIMLKNFQEELIREIKSKDTNKEIYSNIGLGIQINPNYDILKQMESTVEIITNPEIVNRIKILKLSGIFDNLMNFKEIIDSILYLKDNIPPDILLMASGKITPSKFALISYLGFDLIDSAYLLYAGFSDLYYTGEDLKWVKHLKDTDDLWCSCDSCQKLISSGSISHPGSGLAVKNVDNKLIALHNLECGINEIKKIRKKIETGTLRAYLEKKCSDSTFLISSLRYIDSIEPNPIAAVQRLNKKSKLLCIDSLSYKEPQVVRFKNRVNTNYFPDPNTKLCVLLPCSMRKPYSKSKSHRKFIKTIKSAAGNDYGRISQIIITSPLGLVPRELEEVYPAAHYDISVTGTWDAEEIQLTAQSIASFIQKLPEEVPIIARLSEGYLAAFEMAQKIVNNERSYFIAADLDELKEIIIGQLDLINSHGDNLTDNKKNHDLLSNEEQLIRSIADYQFGPGSGKKLIGTTARFIYSRNEKFREIFGFESYGKISLGKFSRDNGQIKLNLTGGERLASNSNNILVLKADITGSTIFRPAVGKLDENLVSGDEVIILDSSENYFGVGQMVVNAKTALKLRRGAVVKIRKKKKKQQL